MISLTERVGQAFLLEHPGAAADVLEEQSSDEVARVLAAAPVDARLGVLRRMNTDAAARALATFDDSTAVETLSGHDPARAARWLAVLDRHDSERLIALLPERENEQIQQALEYPPGTAGALMDAGVLPFTTDTNIESVFRSIQNLKNRRVTDVTVIDREEKLLGVVPLQELVGASPGSTLGQLERHDVPVVNPMTSRDEVVKLMDRHRLASLPVVDFERRLLGIIRYDGLVRATKQALTDDIGRMVGAGSEERALSSPFFTVKSRLPWLCINLLTAFAAAAVVGLFDATIAKFTALAVLLPVVAGQSGNTGAQALAVTSRGLSLREVRIGQWWRVVRKEIFAATMNGVAVAVITSAGVLVWSASLGLAGVIGVSMVVSMVLAALSGAVIPILLTALGRDPATASSIILTTVTDITGFFSFLGLATMMSGFLTA